MTILARLLALPILAGICALCLVLGGQWPWAAFAGLICAGLSGGFFSAFETQEAQDHLRALGKLNEVPLYLTALATLFVVLALAQYATGLNETNRAGPATFLSALGATLAYALCLATAGSIAAHELIHRLDNHFDLFIGDLISAMTFDPADPVEHIWGHHNTVGHFGDPTTARRGEGFWAFLIRSVPDAFRNALKFESARLNGCTGFVRVLKNRVARNCLAIAVAAIGFYFAAGTSGRALFICGGALARLLGENIKYMAHYGLVRVKGQPLLQRHSWNSGEYGNAVILLNSIWHSEHHVRDNAEFWKMNRPETAPLVPLPSGILSLASFVPPLWFSLMQKPLEDWDQTFASPDELREIQTRFT